MGARPLSYRFGDFTLDLVSGCLLKAGEEIKLRPKVYETLKYLVEHPGQLISKQELMQTVWPDSAVTDDSLVQCALELRRALGDRDQQLFRTVPRRGYLFAGPVTPCLNRPGLLQATDVFDLSEAGELRPAKIGRKRNDLPTPRTSLVGCEEQLTDIVNILLRGDVRLVTLTGPGGSGKTRLAIAVAEAIAHRFTAGVQFVGLGSITQPDLVATALADALQIKQVAHRTIPELIGAQLQNAGQFLLLFDNFEQVLPAATLVAETLEACPSLKILVTSRSCLRVYGEHEFPVAPLAQNSATELFAQRAAAVWPDFAITSGSEVVIREICQRLDGLPLAIELAAARTRVLPPTAILARLESRLQLLTDGPLDLPERHHTLRKTIDWSHGLLNEAEEKLFRRISVFVGGCTLESAEAVCNTASDLGVDLFDGLSSLVDKSLIQLFDRAGAEPRFTMLETIREYAFERLADKAEQTSIRRAHAAYCLVLAEEGNPDLSPADRARWLSQCDSEIDNFRFALDWLFATRELDWALRLCVALFRFWDMREHLIEGCIRLKTVLRLAGSQYEKKRATVLHFLGALTTAQGDYLAAEHSLQESLSLYDKLGDHSGIAVSLNALAVSARDRGDYSAAQSYVERSLECWRMMSDRSAIARCLHNLANVVKVRGDYPRASSALREAADIFAELGDRSGSGWSINQQGDIARAQGDIYAAQGFYRRALSVFREAADPWGAARSLTDLAYIDCAQGEYVEAHEACREALETFAGLGYRRGIARALESSACLAAALGQASRALKLAAAATHLRRSVSAPLHGAEQVKLDESLLTAWSSLSVSEGQSAWAEGSAMSLKTAIQYSLRQPESVSRAEPRR